MVVGLADLAVTTRASALGEDRARVAKANRVWPWWPGPLFNIERVSAVSDDNIRSIQDDSGQQGSTGVGDGQEATGISDGSQQSPAQSGEGVDGSSVREVSDNGTGNQSSAPRDLLSAKPFVRAAKLWRDAGWFGTIPLPAKAKNPPPVGWTGRNAGFPDNAQISEWAKLAQYRKGNLGLHLGWPIDIKGEIFEIIGIDVDDYPDNGKIKEGAKQLRELEMQLGPLPRTYVSTARASHGDFNSGIRFYLVPSGLAFRGQANKDIEIIQKNHRFAVVWPSYNPKSDSQYCLYHPDEFFGPVGQERNSNSPGNATYEQRKHEAGGVRGTTPTPLHSPPNVAEIPKLPKKWLEFLTNGLMVDAAIGIDMDSTVDEMEEWAAEQFNDHEDQCVYMRKVKNKWKKQITDEATSHDKVRDAHWELVNCAAEGHTGWGAAIAEIDKHWIEDVMARSKRSVGDMRGEMFRSKINALRKVKVKVDNATSAGGVYTPAECVCAARANIAASGGPGGNAGGLFISDKDTENDDAGPPDGLEHISWGNGKSPDEYETNDDGNGEFLMDLLRYKAGRVKWVEGYGWIVWTDGEPGRPSRWVFDEDGLIRRAFWRVKQMQDQFADAKWTEADNVWAQSGRITPMPANVKSMFALAKKWKEWANRSGNNTQATNAINAAKNFPGVSMDINELNQNPYLLGVANGVIELRRDGAFLRDANADDFVTLNTDVPWTGWEGISEHDIGRKAWEDYLNTFVPADRQRDYQAILGHTIIGGNPERLILCLAGGTSTGKSTMLRALSAALGDYASTVNLTIFGDHKLNPALANAMPKRVVFTSELSAGDKLSVATIKRMTGSDAVRAELKGSNVEVQGVPQFVPIMATNTPPEIPGADEALRRRLLVLPFDQRIDDRKDEKEAAYNLEHHAAEAILSWIVEGFNMYRQLGRIPQNIEVQAATKDFAAQLDHVSEFMSEMTDIGSDVERVPVRTMFAAYENWCDFTSIPRIERLDSNRFSRRVQGLGLQRPKNAKVNGKASKVWFGVRLRAQARTSNMRMVDFRTESEEKGENK